MQAAKDAPPDGNTLLFTASGQLAIQPHTTSNAGYDPFVDFVPISDVARTEVALAVGGQLSVRSLAELKDWLKANPDKAAFASPGAATAAHFAGMELARTYGVPLNHVAYRGAPAALPDLISGASFDAVRDKRGDDGASQVRQHPASWRSPAMHAHPSWRTSRRSRRAALMSWRLRASLSMPTAARPPRLSNVSSKRSGQFHSCKRSRAEVRPWCSVCNPPAQRGLSLHAACAPSRTAGPRSSKPPASNPNSMELASTLCSAEEKGNAGTSRRRLLRRIERRPL